MKAKRKFSLEWVFETFEKDPTFFSKNMFGGLAAYLRGQIVMVLMESPGDSQWKNKSYPFDIWNGILIPTEKDVHASLVKDFPSLVVHPVLPKWLYLPMTANDFEDTAQRISQSIAANDERLGVMSKRKLVHSKKKSKRKSF